jgi:hypothetical protein
MNLLFGIHGLGRLFNFNPGIAKHPMLSRPRINQNKKKTFAYKRTYLLKLAEARKTTVRLQDRERPPRVFTWHGVSTRVR